MPASNFSLAFLLKRNKYRKQCDCNPTAKEQQRNTNKQVVFAVSLDLLTAGWGRCFSVIVYKLIIMVFEVAVRTGRLSDHRLGYKANFQSVSFSVELNFTFVLDSM